MNLLNSIFFKPIGMENLQKWIFSESISQNFVHPPLISPLQKFWQSNYIECLIAKYIHSNTCLGLFKFFSCDIYPIFHGFLSDSLIIGENLISLFSFLMADEHPFWLNLYDHLITWHKSLIELILVTNYYLFLLVLDFSNKIWQQQNCFLPHITLKLRTKFWF